MYAPSFPLWAWLVCVAGMGAIAIGIMLMLVARRASRAGAPEAHVRADGVMGVRLILAGALQLLACAVWRLW